MVAHRASSSGLLGKASQACLVKLGERLSKYGLGGLPSTGAKVESGLLIPSLPDGSEQVWGGRIDLPRKLLRTAPEPVVVCGVG